MKHLMRTAILGAMIAFASFSTGAQEVKAVKQLPTASSSGGSDAAKQALYVLNRDPLLPSPLLKLPIGAITPKGWLRAQLELEAKGMSGRLMEISPWLKFDGSAWADPKGQGKSGWEEMPYWLKGYGDLGYVLKDEEIIKQTRRWIEAILANRDEDGWFGPRGLKTSLKGKTDFWPNMIALNILQSFYEATNDPRVIPFMTKYFKYQLSCPEDNFMEGYWPKMRAGDNLESVYWLYNRTGEAWLLDLAKKIHVHCANWTDGMPNWHGVNIAQCFREPAIYYMQTKDEKFLRATERDYDTMTGTYGQVPGGMYGADENCRPGFSDPRQGAETCAMVEFMHSFEMLTKITGNPLWADRCEEVAFNSLPAAMTPDLKALHYITSPNAIQLDKGNKSPGMQNGGALLSYSPGAVFRCCQHNVAHGWPYYAEEIWLATADRGLCASLYAASEVSAKVGDGTTIKIAEETDYPFADTINLKISTPKPAQFPLYLRVPRWCQKPAVKINGKETPVSAEPLSFIVINRLWADGDSVTLQIPMAISVRTWAKNKNSVSVEYGPLTFGLKIGERWSKYGNNETWPEWEVFPTTPWNYGLVLDEKDAAKSFEIARKPGPLAAQPFTPEAAPIEIKAKAKKIPGWQQDRLGLVGLLKPSPIKSDEPEETVTLIPMGCARLRISAFPTIGAGPDAREWAAPATPDIKASASHCFGSDTVEAMCDGLEPSSSSDRSIPRMTWWNHQGTKEWAQVDFAKPRQVSSVGVYWFDDTGAGQCRVPQSWKLQTKDGETWKDVEGAGEYGAKRDAYNRVSFKAVETKALRLEVELQPNVSGGILEWQIGK
ncbi:MAG: glycoside hydrolase family 127 protein [Candidatus Sumerlaeota bacterium]|nr:glycoside hydrolase family 127 protein [Candidatus Sumerlaeota bacterium]